MTVDNFKPYENIVYNDVTYNLEVLRPVFEFLDEFYEKNNLLPEYMRPKSPAPQTEDGLTYEERRAAILKKDEQQAKAAAKKYLKDEAAVYEQLVAEEGCAKFLALLIQQLKNRLVKFDEENFATLVE